MMKKALTTTLVLLSIFTFSLATYASSEKIVASLDDKNITVENLSAYVDDVAGSNYKSWLNNQEGLRKLADFYINRMLLLEHARKTVAKNDTIVTNHNVRSVDEDVMYLTTLLKIEVQDKVHVTEKEVSTYVKKNKMASEKLARQEMESEQKSELMDALVEKVRAGHEIKYSIK
jgi:hypothetical protein